MILPNFTVRELKNGDGTTSFTEPQPTLLKEVVTVTDKDSKGNEVVKTFENYSVNKNVIDESNFEAGKSGIQVKTGFDGLGTYTHEDYETAKPMDKVFTNLADARHVETQTTFQELKKENEDLKKSLNEMKSDVGALLDLIKLEREEKKLLNEIKTETDEKLS